MWQYPNLIQVLLYNVWISGTFLLSIGNHFINWRDSLSNSLEMKTVSAGLSRQCDEEEVTLCARTCLSCTEPHCWSLWICRVRPRKPSKPRLGRALAAQCRLFIHIWSRNNRSLWSSGRSFRDKLYCEEEKSGFKNENVPAFSWTQKAHDAVIWTRHE